MSVRWVALALALSAAGCSARAASGGAPQVVVQPSGAEAQVMWPEYDQLVALDQEVEMLAAQQDCGGACDAGARLCELSERICGIAERNPDPETEGRCVDGRARCARARERLAICACE